MIRNLFNEKNLVLMDQAVFSGTSFVVTALLARFLGIENFGIYSSIVLAVYLLISMTNALVIQPMQVAFSRFQNSERYLGFTLGSQLILVLIVILIIGLLSLLGVSKLGFLLDINFLYIGIFISSWLLHDYFRKTFLALQEIKNTIVVDCIMASIQLLGIIGLGVTGNLTLNATIILMAAGYSAAVLVSLLIGKVKIKFICYKKEFFVYHKKEGSLLFLSSLLQWWSGNLFVVASGLFLGVAALGAFRLVQSMFGVLNLLLQTYENYVLPKAAKIYAGSQDESKIYLRNITSKGGILFLLVLVPLFIFSKPVILIFGGYQYEIYHNVVRGMVILYTIIYIGYSVRLPIRMLALNKSFFIGYCISFVFSLLTFHFLLEKFGIFGAIAGLIINQILMITYWRIQLAKREFTVW